MCIPELHGILENNVNVIKIQIPHKIKPKWISVNVIYSFCKSV